MLLPAGEAGASEEDGDEEAQPNQLVILSSKLEQQRGIVHVVGSGAAKAAAAGAVSNGHAVAVGGRGGGTQEKQKRSKKKRRGAAAEEGGAGAGEGQQGEVVEAEGAGGATAKGKKKKRKQREAEKASGGQEVPSAVQGAEGEGRRKKKRKAAEAGAEEPAAGGGSADGPGSVKPGKHKRRKAAGSEAQGGAGPAASSPTVKWAKVARAVLREAPRQRLSLKKLQARALAAGARVCSLLRTAVPARCTHRLPRLAAPLLHAAREHPAALLGPGGAGSCEVAASRLLSKLHKCARFHVDQGYVSLVT